MARTELDTTELRGSESEQRAAIRFIAWDDPAYPESLRDLPSPPRELFVLGDLATLTPPVVTVVGTRNASEYGLRVTRELTGALARAGACIVSGMARGIDAAAHRAALAERGRTAAVLGTGVDIPYPAGHRELHATIARTGVVISEFPPGTRAAKGSFPRRNRILAALASVTIVVEAPLDSGARNTANIALDLGRTLAAVPGRIDSPQSAGTNDLLREGAHVIATIEDALMLVGLTPPRRSERLAFDEAERRVLAELERAPADVDTLAARTKLPARECMRAITTLELAGSVECLLTGEVRRR